MGSLFQAAMCLSKFGVSAKEKGGNSCLNATSCLCPVPVYHLLGIPSHMVCLRNLLLGMACWAENRITRKSSDAPWKRKTSWSPSLSICSASVGNFLVPFFPACRVGAPATTSYACDAWVLSVSLPYTLLLALQRHALFPHHWLVLSSLCLILPTVTLKLAPPK